MGDPEDLLPRHFDITRTNISRPQTINLAKMILASLSIREGKLNSHLSTLVDHLSSTVTQTYQLEGINRLGKHNNSPTWLIKMTETLLKRRHTGADADISTELEQFWVTLSTREDHQNSEVILERLKALCPQATFVDFALFLAGVMKNALLFMLKKITLGNRLAKSYYDYIQIHEELSSVPEMIVLESIERQDALAVAKTATQRHTKTTAALKTFAQTLPSLEEEEGISLILGESEKQINLLEIIDLTERNSPFIALYSTKSPITRTSESHLWNYYEADFKVLSLILSLIQSSFRHEVDLQNRHQAEKESLISNMVKTFETISSFDSHTSIANIKTIKSRMEELAKGFYKLESQNKALFLEGISFKKKGVLVVNMNIPDMLNDHSVILNELEEASLESKKLKETLEKHSRDALGRSLPKGEFHPFKGPKDALFWLTDFNKFAPQFEKHSDLIPLFVSQLKLSFKVEPDKTLVALFSDPQKFRIHVVNNYVSNGAVVESSLKEILELPNVTTIITSISNINTTIRVMELFISFDLESYVTDELIEQLLFKCFIDADRYEFTSAWSLKTIYIRASESTQGLLSRVTLNDPSNTLGGNFAMAIPLSRVPRAEANLRDSSGAPRQIADSREHSVTPSETASINPLASYSLDEVLVMKRNFFYTFLVQKLAQLQHTTMQRRRNMQLDSMRKPSKSSFNKGRAHVANSDNKVEQTKPCPIKCGHRLHKMGSLFFCSTFRQKDIREKNAICSKFGICRMCLQRQHIGQNQHIDQSLCPMKDAKCKNCNGRHNRLLCPEQQVHRANLARNEFLLSPENSFEFGALGPISSKNFYSRADPSSDEDTDTECCDLNVDCQSPTTGAVPTPPDSVPSSPEDDDSNDSDKENIPPSSMPGLVDDTDSSDVESELGDALLQAVSTPPRLNLSSFQQFSPLSFESLHIDIESSDEDLVCNEVLHSSPTMNWNVQATTEPWDRWLLPRELYLLFSEEDDFFYDENIFHPYSEDEYCPISGHISHCPESHFDIDYSNPSDGDDDEHLVHEVENKTFMARNSPKPKKLYSARSPGNSVLTEYMAPQESLQLVKKSNKKMGRVSPKVLNQI